MSSALARTWPGKPVTSPAWSPTETRSLSACSPRRRTFSRGSRSRRSARSRPTPRSKGARVIPSAGPYYVASYTPGQGVVLARNPNYHGSRPHHFARIELAVGIPARRAFAEIEAGTADYTDLASYPSTTIAARAARLAARYGPGSAAAARGQPAVLRQPGAPARLLLPEHPPDAVQRRTRTPSGQLRDRPARARSARRLLPAGARAADRPLPAAGNARLPRRTRLSDHTQRSQSARAHQGGPRSWPNRRPVHL